MILIANFRIFKIVPLSSEYFKEFTYSYIKVTINNAVVFCIH